MVRLKMIEALIVRCDLKSLSILQCFALLYDPSFKHKLFGPLLGIEPRVASIVPKCLRSGHLPRSLDYSDIPISPVILTFIYVWFSLACK